MTEPRIPSKRKLEKAGIRIVVGLPMPTNIHHVPFYHFWQIAKRGWDLVPKGYGRTDANRNLIASYLRQNKQYTHVCMLDTDHAHPHDIVETMARWVLEDRDRLVIGTLNFMRQAPYLPLIFEKDDQGRNVNMLQYERGLIPVTAMGHGAIMIDRRVFDILKPPWWAYGYNFADRDIYPSEDMFFCQECLAHGIDLWADTTVVTPHQGIMLVGEEAFHAYVVAQAHDGKNPQC